MAIWGQLRLNCFLLSTIGVLGDVGCNRGWFGTNCNLRCYCLLSCICDNDGQCPNNDRCRTGYFGQGCQYVDLLTTEWSNSTDLYLRDNNETTCNPDTNATSVELSFRTPHIFSWIRIHATDTRNLRNFTTKLNDGEACISERKFAVSLTAVDVTCAGDILVSKILIEGALSGGICSIYVSGGRNLALRQSVDQMSDLNPDSLASKAVDGNVETCSSTNLEPQGPWWAMYFQQPQIIYRILVYNTQNHMDRLQGFSLHIFGNDYTEIYTHNASAGTLSVYDIPLPSRFLTSFIRISQGPLILPSDRYMALCEVQAYGEYQCPEDTFGLFCEGRCNCSDEEVCNPMTGVCAPRCQPGFFGHNCLYNCSHHCTQGFCDRPTGKCFQCDPGYIGEYCESGCTDGLYGDNCDKTCSKLCKDSICGQKTGKCLECIGDRIGPFCEDCEEKAYGPMCEFNCSVHCENETCDPVDGECPVCTDGYEGGRCQHERQALLIYMIPLIPLILLFVLFLMMSNKNDTWQEEYEAYSR